MCYCVLSEIYQAIEFENPGQITVFSIENRVRLFGYPALDRSENARTVQIRRYERKVSQPAQLVQRGDNRERLRVVALSHDSQARVGVVMFREFWDYRAVQSIFMIENLSGRDLQCVVRSESLNIVQSEIQDEFGKVVCFQVRDWRRHCLIRRWIPDQVRYDI